MDHEPQPPASPSPTTSGRLYLRGPAPPGRGPSLWLKRLMFLLLATWDWFRFRLFNNLTYEGREHLADLPPTGVLFVSNHQTYFTEVFAMLHAFAGPRCTPGDGWRANPNVRYVAAVETLKRSSPTMRLFTFMGAVLVKRTWREGERDVQRPVDPADLDGIGAALEAGWLITFPQGTTRAGAPVRKGTAHVIRRFRPVVVPVVVSGFDRAFSRTGLRRIARGVDLKLRFKAPLALAEDLSIEQMVEELARAIEQPGQAE